MTINQEITITREDGIHARPAAELVKKLREFQSDIHFKYKESEIDGKSIIHMMKLALKKNDQVTVIINGPDAEDALQYLNEFL